MSTAYIGILDQTGYNYALVTENATPDKAYPILNNHYNNLSKIYELLTTYKTSAQFKPMKDRLLNNEMRYSIKYFIANQKKTNPITPMCLILKHKNGTALIQTKMDLSLSRNY